MMALVSFLSSKDRTLRLLVLLLGKLSAWLYSLQDVHVWRSADGRVTPLSKMGDDHLVNTMALLVRQGTPRSRIFLPMHHEVERRGLGLRVDDAVRSHRAERRHGRPRHSGTRDSIVYALDKALRFSAPVWVSYDFGFRSNPELEPGTLRIVIEEGESLQ